MVDAQTYTSTVVKLHRTKHTHTGFPGGSVVKKLPAMQEAQGQPLSLEDCLEKEMAAHSSILVWRIPWAEEPGRLQSMG